MALDNSLNAADWRTWFTDAEPGQILTAEDVADIRAVELLPPGNTFWYNARPVSRNDYAMAVQYIPLRLRNQLDNMQRVRQNMTMDAYKTLAQQIWIEAVAKRGIAERGVLRGTTISTAAYGSALDQYSGSDAAVALKAMD